MHFQPQTSPPILAGLLVGALLVLGVALLATSELPASAGSGERVKAASTEPTSNADMKSMFSVFRTATAPLAGAAEALRIQRGAAARSHDPVLDPASIRTAYSDTRGAVRVGAGADLVCLAVRETSGAGSLSCTTIAVAGDPERPLISVTYLGGSTWRASGLLPDSARSVSVRAVDGTREETRLVNNVFSAVVTDHPGSVRWISDDGSTREELINVTPDRATPPTR